MNKTFVIGDIHGALKALEQVLERAEISKDDTLIFLGDYVDGWSQSPQVLDFLMELKEHRSCIFIQGNHDDFCNKWLKTGESNEQWLYHGGQATIDAYHGIGAATRERHLEFLGQLRNYYLDDDNRLFLHAGFTSLHGVEHEYFPEMLYWDRTLWETALSLDTSISEDEYRYPARLTHYREIFIGHTPVTRIGKLTPVNAANVWNVDTGAAFKGPLTIMDVSTKMFWQSEPVWELYPRENGRN
ncbi:metallophosphoesterase family protein [Sinomicrobium weinanense]|uniref:Serine/threonine protein phosphatase n=1 Tax=Sinomicrobium weinanense TaxID=2842200 RepID=A0A926JNH2_9FLAO|nr:metallophosphoesterase family protein [Sinomicrobium weinanense]MBC9794361.1 serine/threonine protein phosphatase [Sinomicrobium weinanense]MBU3124268.1 serine/threonine protein phosphatase [Sinomicrobium weinanense]